MKTYNKVIIETILEIKIRDIQTDFLHIDLLQSSTKICNAHVEGQSCQYSAKVLTRSPVNYILFAVAAERDSQLMVKLGRADSSQTRTAQAAGHVTANPSNSCNHKAWSPDHDRERGGALMTIQFKTPQPKS